MGCGHQEAGQSVLTGKPQEPSVDKEQGRRDFDGEKGGTGRDIPVEETTWSEGPSQAGVHQGC